MPEGPELAYSRDRLKKLIEGKTLSDVAAGLSGRYSKSAPTGMGEFKAKIMSSGPPTVEVIQTHGKFMWWTLRFPDEAWYMHCTYGMSGGWFTSPTKHTAFVVEHGAGQLFFNDQRHFGTLKFLNDGRQHAKKLASLGPCILGGALTPGIFAKNILRKPTRTIAEALMDQSVVAGVGNYLKAETLYRAGISPWRIVSDITTEEYVGLCDHVVKVSRQSYLSQGATISTYRTPDGSVGTTQFDFLVYSRESCPKGHAVKREETPEGRTSHWCPVCQG